MNLGLFSVLLPTLAAAPPAPLPPAPTPAAPVLYVKLIAPEGTRAAFHPGSPIERAFDTPVRVALRPGYCYRVRLENLPGMPGRAIFPTIEVRGSLHPQPGMNVADYPVPVVLTAEDLEAIRVGGLVSKVLYLEDPEQAVGLPSDPDLPIQFRTATEAEAVREARLRGRLMLIFRVGEKGYTTEELAPLAVDGTILFPGEAALPPPAAPPQFRAMVYPPYDPILGPKPATEECLHDGGDSRELMGIGPDGRLHGLNPSDAAVEFTISKGRRVATSNRVCICVPRFLVLRSQLLPVGVHTLRTPLLEERLQGYLVERVRVPPREVEQVLVPRLAEANLVLRGVIGIQELFVVQGWSKPEAVAQRQGLRVVAEVIGPQDITAVCGCPLILQKWGEPNPPHHIGQEIIFYLRYTNTTADEMRDVVVSDNLTARLEYVPGSARSDREATFTFAPNEAGSVVLRWQIGGVLLPGQSGVVAFKAKIR